MDCSACIERLEQYVDRELSEDEIAEVRLHMGHCRDCVRRFEFHEELKRLVRRCCGRERAPERLRERVGELFG